LTEIDFDADGAAVAQPQDGPNEQPAGSDYSETHGHLVSARDLVAGLVKIAAKDALLLSPILVETVFERIRDELETGQAHLQAMSEIIPAQKSEPHSVLQNAVDDSCMIIASLSELASLSEDMWLSLGVSVLRELAGSLENALSNFDGSDLISTASPEASERDSDSDLSTEDRAIEAWCRMATRGETPTMARLAEEIGACRQHLYRLPRLRNLVDGSKAERKRNRPRGHKGRDGAIEAYSEED
jgi:hypothetical protein